MPTGSARPGWRRPGAGRRCVCPARTTQRSSHASDISAAAPAAIRHTDFLHRWRPACDGTPTRSALGATAPDTLPPLCAGLRFHDLRHTHKTILAELGVPEALRDERLGHRPLGMRRVYEHATPGMRQEMIGGLELIWAAVTR